MRNGFRFLPIRSWANNPVPPELSHAASQARANSGTMIGSKAIVRLRSRRRFPILWYNFVLALETSGLPRSSCYPWGRRAASNYFSRFSD